MAGPDFAPPQQPSEAVDVRRPSGPAGDRRPPILTIILAAVVLIAVTATITVLAARGPNDSRRPEPEAATGATPADFIPALEKSGLRCLRESSDPEISSCETPLLLTNGDAYGRMRWYSRNGMQEFEYLGEGLEQAESAKHRQRLRLLTAMGLSAADIDKIIDSLPAAEVNGWARVETVWGDVGWTSWTHPGVTGLRCSGPGPVTAELLRVDIADHFNHLAIGPEAADPALMADLLADLLPILLGPDAEAVQRVVDAHRSDDYYLAATSGYLVGSGYGSLIIESVRW